jgi:hypothetical protein
MLALVAKTAFHSYLPQALRLREERLMLADCGGQQHWVLSKPIFTIPSFFPQHQSIVDIE